MRVGGAELLGESSGKRLQRDAADRASLHFAVFDQLVHHVPCQVARHGETNPLVAAGLAENGSIDSDQFAAGVNQCTARVTGIDRGVGLNEILIGGEPSLEPPAGGADNPQGDRLIQLKWIADRQDPFGDLQL